MCDTHREIFKTADMTEVMQQQAIDVTTQAVEKHNIEKDIATYIKTEIGKTFNPTWHCIVGRNFGSCVTLETKHFIYFYHLQIFCSNSTMTTLNRGLFEIILTFILNQKIFVPQPPYV